MVVDQAIRLIMPDYCLIIVIHVHEVTQIDYSMNDS